MTWWKRLLVMVLAAVLLISAVWWGSGRIIPAMRRLSVSQEVRLPVLMYHGVHSNPKKAGDYVITPQALEEDLLYLQRQGCTTVVMSDLIAYVQQGTPLPEKPVMITFDDGYYNNYLNAYPLLQKYQMKAVISIIVGETDKYSELDENKENYSHITWDMINEMMESGLIEIQNHTYNLHKTGNPRRGAAQRKDETTEQYFAAVGADLQKAQDRIEEMTGWRPNTFTYPFGSYSRRSQELLEQLGFAASLGVEGKPCCLTRDPACLIRIPRYTRTSQKTAEELLAEAKTKRYTHARLRRVLLAAMLELPAGLSAVEPPYLRVLGFTAKGAEILNRVKGRHTLPLSASLAELERTGEAAALFAALEARAADLYHAFTPGLAPCGSEYTTPVIKI